MWEKVGEFLKNLFTTAFHSVTKAKRRFAPLLLALLLVECLFFSVFFHFLGAITTHKEQVNEAYDYHVTIASMTEAEMMILKVDKNSVFTNDRNFKVIHVLKFESENYDPSYTVRIQLLTGNKDYGWRKWFIDDSLEANYEMMCLRYPTVFGTEEEPNTRLQISFSPLYELERDVASLRSTRAISALILGVICTLLLTSFYRVYTDDQRFKFGIYATFGANFRRLRLDAFAEMFICVLFTILPAYYIGALINRAASLAQGVPHRFPVFNLGVLFSVLGCLVPIIFFAVYFPLKLISAEKETMKLILAQDNSATVASPSRSANLLRRSFPLGYEALTAFRFRRHHLRIALTSALVCSLVIGGTYAAVVHNNVLSATADSSTDFTVSFRADIAVTDEQRDLFSAVDGVMDAHSAYAQADGGETSGLLYVGADHVSNNAGLAKKQTAEGEPLYFTGDLRYISAVDHDLIDLLSARYAITGDPYALLDGEDNIIVGRTFRGRDSFSLAPGDKVTLSVAQFDEKGNVILKEGAADRANGTRATGKDLWARQDELIDYTYRTFTVVAVIEDYPSGADGVPLVLNKTAFEAVTALPGDSQDIELRLEEGLSAAERAAAEEQVYSVAALLGSGRREPTCTVLANANAFYERMEASYGFSSLLLAVSALLLFMLPLQWFYSQALFFRKREREMYLLHALFAPFQKIRRLFFSNLPVMLPIGLSSVAASGLLLWILYRFCNNFMPNVLQITTFATTELSLPLMACLVCFLLTLACSVLSAVIPGVRCIKRLRAEAQQIPLYRDSANGL